MSETEVSVREACNSDWPLIWLFWRRIVASGESYMWAPGTSETEARALWMLPPPARVYVAETPGDGVVASAILEPNQPGLGSHVSHGQFMVDPGSWNGGIGRRIADHVVDQARALGYRSMQFNAVVATNERALALWHDIGMRTLTRVPGAFHHPEHGYVDTYVMFMHL
ncbi:GNAT family N-acetyltransferase [Streptomyces sp. NPDC051684]|uniref:GNAT family N-acetyltransferase n=1 Tax=Streptomyces sp. NPDC051684 TaxID=3365670 RepID=UPI0037B02B46